MEENFILHGPKPLVQLSSDSLGQQLFDSLLQHSDLPSALVSRFLCIYYKTCVDHYIQPLDKKTDAITGKDLTYKKILERSCRLADSLRNYGIKQNDVIGIFSENNLDYFYPIIASMYLGSIVTTFNSHYTAGELLHAADISKPILMFCSESTLSTLLEVKARLKCIRTIILLDTDDKHNGYEPLKRFITNHEKRHFNLMDFKPIKVDTNKQIAFILYSSGTTGLPKGVMLTHKNINATIALSRDHRFIKQFKPGSESALGLLPFYHAFGLCVVFRCLIFGRQVVILTTFDPKTFLKTIQDYKITNLHLVPPLANFLAKSPMVNLFDLSSVEVVNCGAAPLSKEIQNMLMKKFKAKMFRQAYGMTETTLGVLGFPLEESKPGSCGKVLPYVSTKVVDSNTGKLLGPNQHGELHFKGDFIMKGYIGNAEATNSIIDKDGWLATGDVGYYDDKGFFYIIDRLKELIKYKGFHVPPAELEAILLTHPKIVDAGVIGVPHESAGELPLAFVVIKPGQNLTEEEIQDFVDRQVSPQKRLRGGVRFINDIPRIPSGKILRRKLRELLNQKPKL